MIARPTFQGLLALLAALAVFVCGACKSDPAPAGAAPAGPSAAKALRFTAIPDDKAGELQKRYAKLAEYLSTRLGRPVDYLPVSDYAASVSALRNSEAHMAWFGGLTHAQCAKRVPGVEAIAQGVEDKAFRTYFIANASLGLKEGDDFPTAIAGKSFTFGSQSSTSGRLMPEFFIRKHLGKAPDQAFSRVGFSGSHDKTIEAVVSGAYEVGAVNFKTWETWVAEGKIDPSKVTLLWKTPPYSDYNWTIRGDLDQVFGQGTRQKLLQAFLDLKDPELLALLRRSGFIPASNAEYDQIRETAEQIGLMDK